MDTTLDMVTPQSRTGSPKAIYNPWMEASTLPLGKALTSNCMNCHRTSAYPRVPFQVPEPGLIGPAGSDLGNKTKLDFLWTIGVQFDAATTPQTPSLNPSSVHLQ